MLHYVMEDRISLLKVMWIHILLVTLTKENPLRDMCYTCKRSCKLGFKTPNGCGFVYNKSKVHGSYTSL